MLTMVLSELKLDSEHLPSSFSWHFLCTDVWHSVGEKLNVDAHLLKVYTFVKLLGFLLKDPQDMTKVKHT